MASLAFIRSVAEKRGFQLPPKLTTYIVDLSAHTCAEQNTLMNQGIPSSLF